MNKTFRRRKNTKYYKKKHYKTTKHYKKKHTKKGGASGNANANAPTNAPTNAPAKAPTKATVDACDKLLDIKENDTIALHFVLGPFMEKDFEIINELSGSGDYTKVIVVAQGGIDKTKDQPWSASLLAGFPANAGMHLGTDFGDKTDNRGWYDAFKPGAFKKNVHFILQLTNSAKPATAKPGTPIFDIWKDFYSKLTDMPLKNLCLMYKVNDITNLVGAPWMHDPIEVLAVMDKIAPGVFFKKFVVTGFTGWNDGYNFIKNTDGNVGELNETFPIIVVPYKYTDKQLTEYHEQLQTCMVGVLNAAVVVNKPPTKIKHISTSIEIYDPDNLVAVSLLDKFASKLDIPHNIYVHSAEVDPKIKLTFDLMKLNNSLDDKGIEWGKKMIGLKLNYNTVANANANLAIVNKFGTDCEKYKYTSNPHPIALMSPYPPINEVGFLLYSNCRDITSKTRINYMDQDYMDQELTFMRFLCPKSIILKGNVFNQIGSNDCKITDECYCHPIRFFTPALLQGEKLGKPEEIQEEMRKHLKLLIADTQDKFEKIDENVLSWKEERERQERERQRQEQQQRALNNFKGHPNRSLRP